MDANRLSHILRGGAFKLGLAVALLLLASSAGIYLLETRNVVNGPFEALWWSVVTVTTVGYGDIVPQSTGGKLLGIAVMAGGIGLVSTLTGNLASLLVERKERKRKGLLEVKRSGHVLILGWNASAPALVRALRAGGLLERGGLALVNDLPQERRDEIAYQLELGDLLSFSAGHIAHENVLHRARPEAASLAYILRQDTLPPQDSDQQAIYAALALRGLAPKLPIYAEAAQPENRVHLLRAGVTELIDRGEISSGVLALLGAAPPAWGLVQVMLGLRGHTGAAGAGGGSGIVLRRLEDEERGLTWGGLCALLRGRDGCLPLALCRMARGLSLEDILDTGQALDQFILELFRTHGRETSLGGSEGGLLVNPADGQSLEGYDGVLVLRAPAPGGEER